MVTQSSRSNVSTSEQYRKWEKERRDRFNSFLDKLASLLPSRSEDEDEDVSKRRSSKVAVVKEAIVYIQELEMTQMSEETLRKMKLLRRQNKKLRALIREEINMEICEEDFLRLTFDQIREALKKSRRSKEETQQASTSKQHVNDQEEHGDVFVASLNPCVWDHNYSLVVQEEPNIEVVAQHEEIVESTNTTLPFIQSMSTNNDGASPVHHSEVDPDTLATPCVISQPLMVKAADTAMIMLHQPLAVSSVPWKLPLPRLQAKRRLRKQGGQHERKRKRKEKLGKEGDNTHSEIVNTDQPPLSNETSDGVSCSTSASVEETVHEAVVEGQGGGVSDKEVTLVSKSPPMPLLAEETLATKEVPQSKSEESMGRSSKRGIGYRGSGKSNKSSYSIAALCQISVNIGEPHPDVSNSPGLVSLASAGTASPAVTDGPRSPSTPISNRQLVSLDISNSNKNPPPAIVTESEEVTGKNMVTDLNKEKENRGNSAAAVVLNSSNEALARQSQPPLLSPTKTFLTSFPVVSSESSRNVGNNTKKTANEGSNNVLAVGNNRGMGNTRNDSTSRIKDLSVFDFRDTDSTLGNNTIKDRKETKRAVVSKKKSSITVPVHSNNSVTTSGTTVSHRSKNVAVNVAPCNTHALSTTDKGGKRSSKQQKLSSSFLSSTATTRVEKSLSLSSSTTTTTTSTTALPPAPSLSSSAPFVDPQMVMSLIEPQPFTAPPPYNSMQFMPSQYGGQSSCNVMPSSMPFYSSNTSMDYLPHDYNMHHTASMAISNNSGYQQSFSTVEFGAQRQGYMDMAPQLQQQASKYKGNKKGNSGQQVTNANIGVTNKSKSQRKSNSNEGNSANAGPSSALFSNSSSSMNNLGPMVSGNDASAERLFSVHQLVNEKQNSGRPLKNSAAFKRSMGTHNSNSNSSSSNAPVACGSRQSRMEKKDEGSKTTSKSSSSSSCIIRGAASKKSNGNKVAMGGQSSYSAESLISVPPAAPMGSILAEPYYEPGVAHGGVMWSHSNNSSSVQGQGTSSYHLQPQVQQQQAHQGGSMLMSFSASPGLFAQPSIQETNGSNNSNTNNNGFEMLPSEPIFLPSLARSKTNEESTTPNCSSFLDTNNIFPFPTLTPPNPDMDHFYSPQSFGCQQQQQQQQQQQRASFQQTYKTNMGGPMAGSVSNFHLSTLFPEMNTTGKMKSGGRNSNNTLPSINANNRPHEDIMTACDPLFLPH